MNTITRPDLDRLPEIAIELFLDPRMIQLYDLPVGFEPDDEVYITADMWDELADELDDALADVLAAAARNPGAVTVHTLATTGGSTERPQRVEIAATFRVGRYEDTSYLHAILTRPDHPILTETRTHIDGFSGADRLDCITALLHGRGRDCTAPYLCDACQERRERTADYL